MKIRIVTPFYLPVKGGISTYVNGLFEALSSKLGLDIKVITKEGKGNEKVSVIKGNKYAFMSKMLLTLFKEKPEIVHAHSHWYILSPVLWFKRYHPYTRVIFTFHTEPSQMLEGIKKKRFSKMLSQCDAVTFVSKNLRDTIEKNLDIKTEKRVIYAGVKIKNTKDDTEVERIKYDLKEKKPVLSFIGPLEYKRKIEGVERLIASIVRIRDSFPSVKLLIIGDGKYKENLEEQVKTYGVENQVTFTGYVDNVYPLLTLTDIYTHISLQEGFPIAILEAMSIGKPIITTKVGGIPEIIKNNDNGVIIEPTIEKLSGEIIDLYNDKKKMHKLSINSRKTVEGKYTWDIMVNEFLEVYGVKNAK